MKILVTRHGQTDWNVLGKIQGQTDIELNNVGRQQARETRNLIKDEKLDLIITSPSKRAKETAMIINENFNVTIMEDSRLMERKYGQYEGITRDEIKLLKETNSEFNFIWDYNKNIAINNMENMKTFCNRIYEFFDEIVKKYKDKNILIVTHGGTAAVIKCYFTKYPLENIVDREKMQGVKNCEIAEFIV